MSVSADSILPELLSNIVSTVAEMDRTAARINCQILSALLFDENGTQRMENYEMTGADGNKYNVAIPSISMVPLSLLYIPEISFEIVGKEFLRVYGEILRNEETKNLPEAGQRLRTLTATLGYNTDIEITGKGNQTHLKFSIYKDSTTMTRFMESWLENPSQEVEIAEVDTLISTNITTNN